ncbi:hypothetical protein LX32DRAFT_292269 [Colletotrichum zoysiae]|uniref:Uncharacterized protein n=1 Tax=Colletotrichum zoysiae TaxID=1216348 RepID=A0AAD9HKX6_9PEZI|nr:hypothetical protein LX32DRAFT_292269 [Colletotrichum zoysiae]
MGFLSSTVRRRDTRTHTQSPAKHEYSSMQVALLTGTLPGRLRNIAGPCGVSVGTSVRNVYISRSGWMDGWMDGWHGVLLCLAFCRVCYDLREALLTSPPESCALFSGPGATTIYIVRTPKRVLLTAYTANWDTSRGLCNGGDGMRPDTASGLLRVPPHPASSPRSLLARPHARMRQLLRYFAV